MDYVPEDERDCYDFRPEQEAELSSLLSRCGLKRTRENVIIMLFGEVPAGWGEDRERQLPPDIQVWPAPDHALGH